MIHSVFLTVKVRPRFSIMSALRDSGGRRTTRTLDPFLRNPEPVVLAGSAVPSSPEDPRNTPKDFDLTLTLTNERLTLTITGVDDPELDTAFTFS